MKKFIGIVLVLCSLALPLAGCKEAISTVTSTTMSELEDIPSQILSTPESAETVPEYNYIHFRYDNIWTVSALVNYEIVDNGQNIKFEINDSRYRDKVFYTSISRCHKDIRSDKNFLKKERDIKNWDISAVTSRYKMFYNCPCGDIFASAA